MLEKIIKCYYEDHRFYHNFNHIKQMFDEADKRGIIISKEQYNAILFHDVVYDPLSNTNEKDSCDVFDGYIQNLKTIDFDADKIKQIIMDTREHIPTCIESNLVIDLDLCILVSSEYNNYIHMIENEYMYTSFEDARLPNENMQMLEEFNTKRVTWLETMLKKDKIFYTKYFSTYDSVIRTNIKNELLLRK